MLNLHIMLHNVKSRLLGLRYWLMVMKCILASLCSYFTDHINSDYNIGENVGVPCMYIFVLMVHVYNICSNDDLIVNVCSSTHCGCIDNSYGCSIIIF